MDWSDRTPEQKAELVEHYAQQGLTMSGIAEKIGVSRNAVIGVAHRAEMKITGRKPKRRKPRRQFNPYNGPSMKPKSQPRQKTTNAKPLGVDLMERKHSQCAYPLWNDGDDHRNCCGQPIEEGSYCRAHADVCYREPYYNGV